MVQIWQFIGFLCLLKKGMVIFMYNSKSNSASEFINHEEILKTLDYANENKDNKELLNDILNKASKFGGLDYKQAMLLLETTDKEINEKIFETAAKIKEKIYGDRIVLFAPLYLSNYCVNGCTYCPFHAKNKTIKRKKLSQEEIEKEVIALQDMGHKRLALETGEDPKNCDINYILESIKTIYNVKHKNGAIRRVNINIAATTVENYKKLRDAEIGTYILFQETYHKENYEKLHPTGPKSNYAYHTEAMDRAMQGGIDDVGIGVLFGLNLYKYDFVGLLMHAKHLEDKFGVGPHTVSVPRICPADDVEIGSFSNAIKDELFLKIIAILRISLPYAGIIVSTRESEASRGKALKAGVSQISGASKTSVGGYTQQKNIKESQFELSDERTLDEIVKWLLEQGYTPSFCTACYREGRTGDRFMSLAKSGQIGNVCGPNSLITLKEYLCDYATQDTLKIGKEHIACKKQQIKHEKVAQVLDDMLNKLENGQRDFRF